MGECPAVNVVDRPYHLDWLREWCCSTKCKAEQQEDDSSEAWFHSCHLLAPAYPPNPLVVNADPAHLR